MTGRAPESRQGLSQAFQARPLGRMVGQIPLLFAVLDGIELWGIAARVNQNVILVDHGIDPGRLIGREVFAREARSSS